MEKPFGPNQEQDESLASLQRSRQPHLASSCLRGILFLLNLIQEYDKDGSGYLDRLEFEEMMSKMGVFLARQELTTVYNHFDQNKDGNISYQEFLATLRVRLDIVSRQIVRHERKEVGSCKTCLVIS